MAAARKQAAGRHGHQALSDAPLRCRHQGLTGRLRRLLAPLHLRPAVRLSPPRRTASLAVRLRPPSPRPLPNSQPRKVRPRPLPPHVVLAARLRPPPFGFATLQLFREVRLRPLPQLAGPVVQFRLLPAYRSPHMLSAARLPPPLPAASRLAGSAAQLRLPRCLLAARRLQLQLLSFR